MVAANGIYKLAVIGTVYGQQHIHTLHFRSTLAGSSVGMAEDVWMADLISSFQGAPTTAYRALFPLGSTPVELFQVRKVCGSTPLPAGVDQAQPGAASGGTVNPGASEPLAPWLASVTTVRTALAGRRNRGRFFIGGMLENQVNGALLLAPILDALTAYADALRAAYVAPLETAVNRKAFVYSRTQAGVVGTACQNAGADVTSYQVRNQLATMKSRKAGSGI